MKLKLVDIDKLITDISDIHIEDLDYENEWNQALSLVQDIIYSIPELWWTVTNEQYPEVREDCIITNGKQTYIWYLICDSDDNYKWSINNSFWYSEIDYFTHWMYLPLLPKI